jgi:hypothetical protein
MQFDEFSSATCPRCTAPIAIASAACGRCGLSLEPTPDGRHVQAIGPLCPRCDRVDVPGAQFAGVTGRSVHGSCGNCGTPLVSPEALRSSAYEERAVSSAAVDLERLARVEAVDGWQLLDTTVDPAAPERIIAHFRRGLQAQPARSDEAHRRRQSRKTAGGSVSPGRRGDRPVAASRQDPDTARARKAVEALEIEARSALDREPSPGPGLRVKASRREAAAAARRARVEAKAERRQSQEAGRRLQFEAREARRQARFAKRLARMSGQRRPAGRHARGALKGGNMAAVGLVSLVAHLLVLGGFVLFRYLVLPILLLALVVARAVFEALIDELVHRPRRRNAYRRRHHARWV